MQPSRQHSRAYAVGPSQSSNLAHSERTVEPVADRLARVLAVVPSLGPTAKAWKRLGFTLSDPFDYHGCRAQDVGLDGPGLRFLAPGPRRSSTPVAEVVSDRLIAGSGLLGWSWACESVARAKDAIEESSGRRFADDEEGPRALVVPSKVTPGAITLLEPLLDEEASEHANGVNGVDQIVVTVSDAERAASAYETAFGLSATRTPMSSMLYAFMRIGEPDGVVLELVGPKKPEPGALVGHTWGVTFRTPDIDATIASMRKAQIDIPDPQDAIHGGRITSFPMQLGGINIAFMGD